MSSNSETIIRTACQMMAKHGENAARRARAHAKMLRNDPKASLGWEKVAVMIDFIFNDELRPAV